MEKIKQPNSLLSRNEEVYVSKEAKLKWGSRLPSEGKSFRPEINCRKSLCGVSRSLSMGQETKIMRICSVIIYPLDKKIIGTSSILALGKSRVLPTDPLVTQCIMPGSDWNSNGVIFHLAGRQGRQYVFPLNIIYNASS